MPSASVLQALRMRAREQSRVRQTVEWGVHTDRVDSQVPLNAVGFFCAEEPLGRSYGLTAALRLSQCHFVHQNPAWTDQHGLRNWRLVLFSTVHMLRNLQRRKIFTC